MPPQLYQQLMSMPPHIQQQVLAGQGFPPGMPPPPGSPYDPSAPERRSQSPAQFPYYAQGPGGMQPPASPQQHQPVAVGAHAINGANLMALLSGGRNTPTN
jgi:collagen type III alpha